MTSDPEEIIRRQNEQLDRLIEDDPRLIAGFDEGAFLDDMKRRQKMLPDFGKPNQN
jgi:hypothetical protein